MRPRYESFYRGIKYNNYYGRLANIKIDTSNYIQATVSETSPTALISIPVEENSKIVKVDFYINEPSVNSIYQYYRGVVFNPETNNAIYILYKEEASGNLAKVDYLYKEKNNLIFEVTLFTEIAPAPVVYTTISFTGDAYITLEYINSTTLIISNAFRARPITSIVSEPGGINPFSVFPTNSQITFSFTTDNTDPVDTYRLTYDNWSIDENLHLSLTDFVTATLNGNPLTENEFKDDLNNSNVLSPHLGTTSTFVMKNVILVPSSLPLDITASYYNYRVKFQS